MKHKRLVVGAVVSSVLVGASWGSVASAQPTAAHHAVKPLSAPGSSNSVPRPGAAVSAAVRAGSTPAQPTVQHLDPALAAVAGVAGADAADLSKVPVAHGTVQVSVTGPQAVAAARSVGAEVLGQFGDKATVSVATSRLQALAATAGVEQVTTPTRPTALADGVVSEGVQASGASAWAADGTGKGGAGVKIGIVDVGFAQLGAEEANGNIANVVYPAGQNHCGSDGDTATGHGTAVAEIAHQMAPQAQIYLYCIVDSTTFSAAAAQLTASGVKIVNSSLGFVGESRGDGNGPAGTTEAAVKKARQAGVLWVQSSGNSAQDHWSGSLSDRDSDGFVDMNGTSTVDSSGNTDFSNEGDGVGLAPGTSGASVLTWDQWPASSLPITLTVVELAADGVTQVGSIRTASQAARTTPYLEIDYNNTSTENHFYYTFISIGKAAPTVRYDLYELGEVGSSYLSSVNPAHAAGGSMEEPATSPYALSVGAVDWRAGNALEPFSSRGATIDGRIKPDVVSYDGVSSNIDEVMSNPTTDDSSRNGFYGTSAASPHVAGAAALMLAAHPSLTATDLAAYLELKSSPLVVPANNNAGNGLIHLPAATSATCTVTPVLPAKVAINSAHVTFGSTMSTNCAHFYERGLLNGPRGSVDSLTWRDKVRAIGHLTAATAPVGWYTAAHQVGFSAAGASTFKAPAKMLVKYATTTSMVASRSGRTVTFTGHATNYSKAGGRMVPAGRRTVLLQRLVHGKWVNVLSRPTSTTGGFSVKFVQPGSYRYRLDTTETGAFFGALSAEAVR